MISASTSILLFTRATIADRALFRAVRVSLSVSPGRGRLLLDASRGNAFQPTFQRQVEHLYDIGRSSFEAPWEQADLVLSPCASQTSLDGASASLPIFVAWLSLLCGAALEEPFYATGVAAPITGALTPAPRPYIEGKLKVADALARAATRPLSRQRVWVPEGSDFEPAETPALVIREVSSLTQAASEILGVAHRAQITARAPALAAPALPTIEERS